MDASTAAARASDADRLAESVLELGQLIVPTLGTHQADVMSQWIATRIAELMDRSKSAPTNQEREEAAERCQELILAVWDRRNTWGGAWPPRGLDPIVQALTGEGSIFDVRRPTTDTPPSSWTDALAAALTSLARERDVWLAMAARETPVEAVDRWIQVLQQLDELVSPIRATHLAALDALDEIDIDEINGIPDLDLEAVPTELDSLQALSALVDRATRSTQSRTRASGQNADRGAPQQLSALWRERRSWVKAIERKE